VRNGTAAAAVTAEHLATEEIALAGDPFVSPRVTGRELRYEWRANLLKQAGSIDEVITRAGHFILDRARFIAESFDFEQGFRHTLSRHACKAIP
jgi:hypothetical protein